MDKESKTDWLIRKYTKDDLAFRIVELETFNASHRRHNDKLTNSLTACKARNAELRARVAELEAERAELVKDRERLKNGWALTAEGMLISNIHEVLHTSEDWKCCMMAMDDAGVPRTDDHGAVYSIWGRACWMLRSGDPLYQSDRQAIDAAGEGE